MISPNFHDAKHWLVLVSITSKTASLTSQHTAPSYKYKFKYKSWFNMTLIKTFIS